MWLWPLLARRDKVYRSGFWIKLKIWLVFSSVMHESLIAIVCFSPCSLTLPNHPVWKADRTHLPVSHGAPAEPRAWLDGVVMCLPVYTCCAEHPLTCTAGTDRQSHDNPAWRTTSHWKRWGLTPQPLHQERQTEWGDLGAGGGVGRGRAWILMGWILNSHVLAW